MTTISDPRLQELFQTVLDLSDMEGFHHHYVRAHKAFILALNERLADPAKVAQACGDYTEIIANLRALLSATERYMQHLPNCGRTDECDYIEGIDWSKPCDCGLDAYRKVSQ